MTKTRINKLVAAFFAVVITIAFYGYMPRNIAHAQSQADAIVSVALAEEGYTEGANNYSKYGEWYYNNVSKESDYAHAQWCAMFISWCARQANIPTSVIKNNAWAGSMGSSKCTGNFGGQYYPKGSITPQKGDIVYYGWGSSTSEHVEIVVSTTSNTITSIGGNTGGGTKVYIHRNYSFTSSNIVGYERPNYNGSVAPPSNDDELGIGYPRPSGSPYLQSGSSGSGVCWLQTALNKANNAGLAVDGQFGSGTKQAVINFQSANGLEADGIVGPATINKLVEVIKNKDNPPAPTLGTPKITDITHGYDSAYDKYVIKIYWSAAANATDYTINVKNYAGQEKQYNVGNVTSRILPYNQDVIDEYGKDTALTFTITANNSSYNLSSESSAYTIHIQPRCWTGHSYGSWTTERAASCLNEGSEKRTCSVCGKSETRTISAKGHSYISKVVPPTHTEEGYTLHTCTNCGNTYKDNYTDKLVLEFTASGSSVNISMDKNEKKCITFSYKNAPPDVKTVNVNVTSNGKAVATMKWGEWEGHSIPLYFTALKTGTGSVTVKLNDADTKEVLATKTINVTVSCDHSFGEWTTTKSPTCNNDGISERVCSICGKTETEYLATTGHKWSEWTVIKEATCTKEGEKRRKCSICGAYSGTSIPMISHKYTKKIIDPTYTEYGYTLYTCSLCGDSYKDNYTNKLVKVQGDINADGKFNVSDAVLLQNWLLAVPNTNLADWKAADLCEDDRLDVFDLCMMKRMLVENS